MRGLLNHHFISLYKPGHSILDVVLLDVQRSLFYSPIKTQLNSLGGQSILIVALGTVLFLRNSGASLEVTG